LVDGLGDGCRSSYKHQACGDSGYGATPSERFGPSTDGHDPGIGLFQPLGLLYQFLV
jgi:hypothetical protein